MTGLFEDPYKYVIDTSALVDLKMHYRPTVFKGVWEKFNKLCDDEVVISVREVLNEIKRGSDWLVEWAEQRPKVFHIPSTTAELHLIGELQEKNPYWIDPNSDKPSADPFVIACAVINNLIIVQHETPNKNLPRIAREQGITCIRLQDLFEAEKWEF